ncbi:MAG TPA: hypothetical protein PLD88_05020, partial [Candidatus Berkiella sp.]|nr:hypothetical protein [Candidatus Berkiella sp.]
NLLATIDLDELKQVNGFFYKQLIDEFGEESDAVYSIRCVLDVKSPADTKKTNLEKEISDALCRLDERKKRV